MTSNSTQSTDAGMADIATRQPQSGGTLLDRIRALAMGASVATTVATSLAVFGLQAFHSILLGRLLGPVGRGEYGTAVFYSQTMLYIGLMGTLYSIARVAALPDLDHRQLQRAAFRVGLITGATSGCIALFLCFFGLPSGKHYLIPLCIICTLMLPAEHLRLTAQAVDHGRGKFNRYNLSRLFAAAVFPALVLILFVTEVRNLELIAWITVLVSIGGYAFYWLISDCRSLLGPASPRAFQLLRDGLPDGAWVLMNDLYERLAIFLVLWMVTLEDQGLYLTALPAASLLLVAPNALELFSFRAAANSEVTITLGQVLRASVLVVAIQLALMLGLQLILEPLILFLLGEEFRAAIPVARVLLVATSLSGCAIVGQGYLRGRNLAKIGILTRCIAMTVMVFCLFNLNAYDPLIRIALAVCIGHAAGVVLVACVVFRDASQWNRELDGATP